MTNKHTPGPWIWDEKEFVFRDQEGNRIICGDIEGGVNIESEGDIPLIAASPNMLTVLEHVAKHLEGCRRLNCPPDTYMLVAVENAIKEAKGEK